MRKKSVQMVISIAGMAICCLWGCSEGEMPLSDLGREEQKLGTRDVQAETLAPEERLLDRGEAAGEPDAFENPEAYRACASGTVVEEKLLLEDASLFFYASEIPEEVFARMDGVSYVENEDIELEELRYLRLLYRGFDGKTHVGELVVHESISESILAIFQILYENGYPIEKMRLVDDYGGDDEASMRDNNTSAFHYRKIAGSETLSRHALGLAIDINPLYNPFVENSDGEGRVSPAEGRPYAKRGTGQPYQIGGEGDLCLQLFRAWGFEWGGDWAAPKDYQHFEMRRRDV